jgi:hypothetical protein
MELKSANKQEKRQQTRKKIMRYLLNDHRIILGVIFLSFLFYYGYLWYLFAYDAVWDEKQKAAYVESQSSQSIIFNETKFQEIFADIAKRKNEYVRPMEISRDIFKTD